MNTNRRKIRKLKKSAYFLILFFLIIILIIVGAIFTKKYLNKINSYEYKLSQIGYNEEEIKKLTSFEDKFLDELLKKKYDKYIYKFAKQDYFIWENLDRYLEYKKDNNDDSIKHIISIVNVNADYDPYDEAAVTKTNVSKGNLMLVNKYNNLDKDYVIADLQPCSLQYSYADNYASEETISAFKNMWSAAKEKGLKLMINSSYRDYASQEEVWQSYEEARGEEYADSIAARAGFSEHQTGLALDIITPGANKNTFDQTEEFKWLEKNAYKYGFILRYPNGKEDITGYEYESWHFRYVGKEIAKIIKEKNITYDEYYAFYER